MDRLVMPEHVRYEIENHLASAAPVEQGTFCLIRVASGATGRRLLVIDLVLPNQDDWQRQGEDELVPTPRYVSRAISAAIAAEAGLLFVHSHPRAAHPAELSPIDDATIRRLAATVAPMLDGLLAAAVVHLTSWAAVVWDGEELAPIGGVWSSGARLEPLHRLTPPPDDDGLDIRQRDALHEVHDVLRSCTVGVVGVSGNGSPVAEQLLRVGVREVVIVDHDVLDTPSNLRRVQGSTRADLAATTPPRKVDVVGGHLDLLGFDTTVRRVHGDVRNPQVLRHLLDCDVVLATTDTHASRAIMTQLPAAVLLPVIDVGVRAASFDGQLGGLWAEFRRLTPGAPCLWCADVLDAYRIRAESLPPEMLERELEDGYLPDGFGEPAPSVMPLNGLAASLATCQLLTLLSAGGAAAPVIVKLDGFTGDSYPAPVEANPGCTCQRPPGHGVTGLWPEEGE